MAKLNRLSEQKLLGIKMPLTNINGIFTIGL